MKTPLTSYMKVGIVHFMAYPATMKGEGPVLEQSHMELGFGAQPSLLTTGFDLNSFDEAARRAAIDQIRAMIDMAHEMGVKRRGRRFEDAERSRGCRGRDFCLRSRRVRRAEVRT